MGWLTVCSWGEQIASARPAHGGYPRVLLLYDRASLHIARGCSRCRWRPHAASRALQSTRCKDHRDERTHLPMHISETPADPPEHTIIALIYREIILCWFWLTGWRMGGLKSYTNLETKKTVRPPLFFHTESFAVIRTWSWISTSSTTAAAKKRQERRATTRCPGLAAIPSMVMGAGTPRRSRSRGTLPRRRRRRRYFRDRLNSSDDVIGTECVSTSTSSDEQNDPAGEVERVQPQAVLMQPDEEHNPEVSGTAASRGAPTQSDEETDEAFDVNGPEQRRIARAEAIAYRQLPGPAWDHAGAL